MDRRRIFKKLVPLLFGITLISVVLVYLQNLIGLEKIREIIIQTGPVGPIIFVILMVVTHIFAPLQGSPVLLTGMAIFGKWAIIYTYVATIISSLTNFLIARKFGRALMIKFVGQEAIAKVDHIATHEGPIALVIMRLFQGWITDFISYAAGLTSIKFSTYYLISVLVPIPWTILFFLLFDQFDHLSLEKMFSLTLAVGGLMFIIPPVYYYFKHRFTKGKIIHTSKKR